MSIRAILWNVQDLFIFLDKYNNEDVPNLTEQKWQLLSTSFYNNKELNKVIGLRDFIQKEDPDICFLTEVGGRESVQNFVTHFLDKKYFVVHSPSNSDRGIDLAILVKIKLFPLAQSKFHSHKVFARGVLQLSLTETCGNKSHFLLTHLKSKLNKSGKDFEGRSQRQKEVHKIIDIYKKLKSHEKTKSIYVLGDLNGIIDEQESEKELAHFAKNGLQDILKFHKKSDILRTSYIYFNKQAEIIPMQLDYVLANKQDCQRVNPDCNVKDFNNISPIVFPINLKQKQSLPSDHYPITFSIDLCLN